MEWDVQLYPAFEGEVLTFERDVRIALLAVAKLLADFGPQLGRPHAETLKGSKFPNTKELRSIGRTANGTLPSPSIPNEGPSFLWRATSLAAVRSASTRTLSQRRICGFPNIWKA